MKHCTLHTTHYFLFAVLVALIVALCGAVELYHDFICNMQSRDGEAHAYYIYPSATIDSVLTLVSQDYDMASKGSLRRYARFKHMTCPQAGYYQLGTRISNRTLLTRLQYGQQTPVRLSFTNQIRNREQLAARMGKVLMLDSAEVMTRLDSVEYLATFGLNKATAVCLFIPNTYEVYWTMTPDQLFERMQKEYNRFWNEERCRKAEQLGLTKAEVATLASIVESETHNTKEHPLIASLYLNRLRKGMALQACPTVIFATGDFSLHRVLRSHLQMDSPYNTYKYAGLPPGPIRCPNGAAMDAVLNAPKTNYLYMCANADWSGTHVFSSTFAEHERAAVAYRRELNRRKIK